MIPAIFICALTLLGFLAAWVGYAVGIRRGKAIGWAECHFDLIAKYRERREAFKSTRDSP